MIAAQDITGLILAGGRDVWQRHRARLDDEAVRDFQIVLRLENRGVLRKCRVQRIRQGKRARQPVRFSGAARSDGEKNQDGGENEFQFHRANFLTLLVGKVFHRGEGKFRDVRGQIFQRRRVGSQATRQPLNHRAAVMVKYALAHHAERAGVCRER